MEKPKAIKKEEWKPSCVFAGCHESAEYTASDICDYYCEKHMIERAECKSVSECLSIGWYKEVGEKDMTEKPKSLTAEHGEKQYRKGFSDAEFTVKNAMRREARLEKQEFAAFLEELARKISPIADALVKEERFEEGKILLEVCASLCGWKKMYDSAALRNYSKKLKVSESSENLKILKESGKKEAN